MTNGRKSSNLIKSYEVICHFIKLYLVPLPSYFYVNQLFSLDATMYKKSIILYLFCPCKQRNTLIIRILLQNCRNFQFSLDGPICPKTTKLQYLFEFLYLLGYITMLYVPPSAIQSASTLFMFDAHAFI